MSSRVPELKGFSEREAALQLAVEQCARLMLKADNGELQIDELDKLLHTETKIRKQARALGLTSRQLELMLERNIRRLRG